MKPDANYKMSKSAKTSLAFLAGKQKNITRKLIIDADINKIKVPLKESSKNRDSEYTY